MIDWADAINRRLLVRFNYDGFERVVIPAAYGLNRHSGNELIRAYQVAGGDSTRALPVWSLFNAAKVIGGAVTEERFADVPPGYERNDSAMDVIYAQL
ncbi:MAG TPA: hypothetical protein VFL58_03005 [Gaiellaceae bacterium]|nr:hypothetical protein [Gaiellaceae bacterium]